MNALRDQLYRIAMYGDRGNPCRLIDEIERALVREKPAATYRLLKQGEQIERGDEVLSDDTLSWLPLSGWETRTTWDGVAMMPIRRRASGVKAAQALGYQSRDGIASEADAKPTRGVGGTDGR